MNEDFFQDIAKLEEQRTLQHLQAFNKLARDIVNGSKGVTAAVALDILTAAGKTREDLEQAQREYSARVNAANLVAQEKTITAQLHAVAETLDVEDKKLQQALESHRAVTVPLVEKRGQLTDQIKAIESAKKLLRSNCPDPVLLAEETAINQRSMELLDEHRDLNVSLNQVARAKDRIEYLDSIRGNKTPEELAERASCVELVKTGPDLEKRMKKNRLEYTETLPKRLSALHSRMLNP